jgi:hypothetical protein
MIQNVHLARPGFFSKGDKDAPWLLGLPNRAIPTHSLVHLYQMWFAHDV